MSHYYDNVAEDPKEKSHKSLIEKVRNSQIRILIENGLTINELFDVLKIEEGMYHLLSEKRLRQLIK